MTRESKIPMLPTELPQQRIHEVVDLPERPAEFDYEVGYGVLQGDAFSKNAPTNSIYLCQVEWAWSPMHNRINAYYLHRSRTNWSLWFKYWDNNWGRSWNCGHRSNGPRNDHVSVAQVFPRASIQ